ncbi:carbohydrate kinase family protein [Patescibacteria group bacterium]|nr:carbohydrate kinase family protein [Patescibacteria group bacterium]
MFDIITIGSATRDAFLKSEAFHVLQSTRSRTGKMLGVPLGSKLDLEQLEFSIGGGAVNTAVTFANQGLRVAPVAVIGEDLEGEAVGKFLKEQGVATPFLFRDKEGRTSLSLILSVGEKDRTILSFEGVKWHFTKFPFPFKELGKAKWLYVNHVGGRAAALLPKALAFAEERGVQVAWNPGRTQLNGGKRIRPLLKYADVFLVNQEEASEITGVPYQRRNEIFAVLDKWVKGIVVMTRGAAGVEVSDGKTRWSSGVLPLGKVTDRTGAGDAFGSGFVSSLVLHPGDIETALQTASANATGVLREWGTTKGLLEKGESPFRWGKLKVSLRKT